uniref:Uncharacterized protein n=1 Tax=Trichuris muris TaxID=70415 RepID=A0A5S6Q2D8_TRIMR
MAGFNLYEAIPGNLCGTIAYNDRFWLCCQNGELCPNDGTRQCCGRFCYNPSDIFLLFFGVRTGGRLGAMKLVNPGVRSYVNAVFSYINVVPRKLAGCELCRQAVCQQLSSESALENARTFLALSNAPKKYDLPNPSMLFPIVGPPRNLFDILAPRFGVVEIPTLLPSPFESRHKRYAHRMIRIRRRKIKKHWRMKRFRRRRAVYLRVHAEKKQRAEKLFLARVNTILNEGLQFKADQYVRGVIERAKWKPSEERLPSGKVKLPHWTSLISIEELYGLKQTDYIDKKSCIASPEEWSEILKLKKKYHDSFGKLVKD